MNFDLLVVGGGPCGSACAIAAAQRGLRVAVLERAVFPRDKVCGDCLHPSVLPLLDLLQVRDAIFAAPHSVVRQMQFEGFSRQRISFPIASERPTETVIRRSVFDQILLNKAAEAGAAVFQNELVENIERGGEQWKLRTSTAVHSGKMLVAADGRNSTVGRLLQQLPSAKKERIGIHAHIPCQPEMKHHLRMFFLRSGYGGFADCGGGVANLCLVGKGNAMNQLKEEALQLGLFKESTDWGAISPISREPVARLAGNGVFFAGDAARVVEPFTGEGIYYALKTGMLAAEAASRELHSQGEGTRWYRQAHARAYTGRIAMNAFSRFAGEHPRFSTGLLQIPFLAPFLLRRMTAKVLSAT